MLKINNIEIREREEDYINLNPIQTGGRLTKEARKALISYCDGYSVCDYCPGALHIMKKPNIENFVRELADFVNMDFVLLTNGCREAKFIVMYSITKPGDIIVMDSNKHYTSWMAAERVGLKIYEVPNSGYPEFKINPEDYKKVFEEVKEKEGKYPNLALLTHVDGNYGNLVNAKKVGKICGDYKIPFLLNSAYSGGRMPINGKKINADFIAFSCHKSWSSSGPLGFLAIKGEWKNKILKESTKYKNKFLEILGCSARACSVLTLMVSFPSIKERVKKWDEEIKKMRWFVKEIEPLGIKQLGETPHNHDLVFLETPVFDKIAKKHKRKGFFLAEELKSRGIVGIKPGRTKNFKISTYGLSWDQIKYLAESFKEIVEKY